MRAVIQRVSEARVTVDGVVVGEIGIGMLLLVGVASGDAISDVDVLVTKAAGLRIFADDRMKMNRSIVDVGGNILVVSQFTLLADARRGRRPSFTSAAPPTDAEPLVEALCEGFRKQGIGVEKGVFGARMEVALVNEGPVTIILETDEGQIV
ncbi:MAG: D-aminoacyl-tRNA deacylase [Actinomycetia bacterium]|nr:D-aminoacyl-tRNA deacylase [Actinomycetes bacterium]